MKSFFKELFEYNHHSNLKLSEIFMESHGTISEKSVQLFSHILNAHHIWISRITDKKSDFGVWDIQAIQQLKEINENNFNSTIHILNHFDLDKVISYQNSKRQAFENKISDILFHIINHSTYHRGQIATNFRQNGIEPLNTDYIFYKR